MHKPEDSDTQKAETKKPRVRKSLSIYKSTFEFKRWQRIYYIQKDIRAGKSWAETMALRKCSRATVQRALKLHVPDDVIAIIENPAAKSPEKFLAATSAKRDIKCDLNPLDFVEDKDHLNFKLFPMQRVILKAFYGIPLDDKNPVEAFKGKTEQQMLDELVAQGKCTWKGLKEYRELVLVVGMKGGKSALAGVLACIEEYSLFKHEDFREHYGLPKGKQVLILNVAANEEQARQTIFAEVDALIKNSPYYQRRQAPNANATSFHFEDVNVLMKSGHSNSNALVGPLQKAVLLDELDRFSDKKDGKSSGMRMYNSISRSTAPFKNDGKIISISSPMSINGPIIRLFNMSKAEPTMLGFWLATWELNPNLPFESDTMQADLRKCPEDFWRDFGAQPAHSLEKYYRDRAKIDAVFKRAEQKGYTNPISKDGVFANWFVGNPNFNYHLHMDPAVKNDHFGLAMAHREGAHVIVDLVHQFKAESGEIDYQMVSEFLDRLCERFPTLNTATYDVYLAVALYQALQKKGINTEFLRVDKEEHDKLKIETIYNDRLICYNCPELRRELRDLNLVAGRKVDHPLENEEGGRGSKDIADAVAGAVVACLAEGEFTEAAACFGGDEAQQESQGFGGGMFSGRGGSMFGNNDGESAGMFGSFGDKKGGLIW